MLEHIKNGTSRFLKNLVRLRHWKRKPDRPPMLTIDERITQKININALTEANIELSIIEFPTEGLSSKESRIRDKVFFKCIFSQQEINNFSFTNCKFVTCVFNGANISKVEFHDCTFDECFFYKTKFQSTYIDPKSFLFSDKWEWDLANVNAGLFQTLYRNSKDMHQDEFAMHADRKFQFYRRYQHLRGTNPKPHRFISSLIFDYALGYGYGIVNALIITSLYILIFAFFIEGNLKENGSFFEALYFSIVSFTTVGYGEVTPLHETLPLALTILFLLGSVGWCAVVTAIIVKRIVK
ncbi:ion channel [Pseudomonas fluorescens group sp. PF-69]